MTCMSQRLAASDSPSRVPTLLLRSRLHPQWAIPRYRMNSRSSARSVSQAMCAPSPRHSSVRQKRVGSGTQPPRHGGGECPCRDWPGSDRDSKRGGSMKNLATKTAETTAPRGDHSNWNCFVWVEVIPSSVTDRWYEAPPSGAEGRAPPQVSLADRVRSQVRLALELSD